MKKNEIRACVIGARFTAALVFLAALSFGAALARMYPAAVLGGLALWALGNALVLAENWHLRRWKVMKRLKRRKL